VGFEGSISGDIYPDNVATKNDFNLVVHHRITGLGKIEEGASVTVSIESYGEITSRCYNKGRTAAPGQNPIAEGSGTQKGEVSTDSNGEYSFDVTSDSECTCGQTCTEQSGDLWNTKTSQCQIYAGKVKGQATYDYYNKNAELCTADIDDGDAEDGIFCPRDCACRVLEGAELDCSNTQNWNQYADGVTYNSFTLDAVYNPVGDGVKEVERLACEVEELGDGTYIVPDYGCAACELCRESANSGVFCDYENILKAKPMSGGCVSG